MLSQRSVKCSSDALRASLTPRRPSRPPAQRRPSSPPSTWTYTPQHATCEHFHQHCLTRLTPHSLTLAPYLCRDRVATVRFVPEGWLLFGWLPTRRRAAGGVIGGAPAANGEDERP